MNLFGSRNEETLIGIVEVGNGSVGASLVRLDRKGPPHILASSRLYIQMQDLRTAGMLHAALVRELPQALQALHQALPPRESGALSEIVFLLSAPWVRIASIRTLRFSRTAPFRVTEDLLERMLADEMRLSQRTQTEDGFSILERTIVGLRLNGYQVSTLPASAVNTAEVTFFTALGANDVLAAIADASEEFFPRVRRSFHSTPLAAYHGMATLYPSLTSYVFVNVTGEMTELLHVEEGAPVAFGTFPVGRNFLLRTLEANAMPVHEALSAIELARHESSRLSLTLKETLDHTQEEWRRSFREALSALVPSGSFPDTVLVVCDVRLDAWFADAVAREEFLAVSRGTTPTVKTLPISEFGRAIIVGRDTPDSLAALTALFADARFDAHKTIELLSTKMPLGIPSRATLKA